MSSFLGGLLLLAQQGSDPESLDPGLRMTSSIGPALGVIWTISMGILAGLLVVALVYGVTAIISRKAGLVLEELVFDGVLRPIFAACLLPVAIALLAMPFAPVRELFRQVGRFISLAVVPSRWEELPAEAPDAQVFVWSGAFVLVLFVAGLALRLLVPKVAAVAYTTGKEGIAQPLFWVVIALVVFLLLLSIWLPYSTFGEDIKMLKIIGLELLTPFAVLVAVAAASVSVAQEVEGRTALTVLSKPISRRQFVVGKFIGVLIPVLVLFIILGLFYLGTVSYKTVYEGFETGRPDVTPVDCRDNVVAIVPALILRFMAAVLMAAISVTVSTRLPMLANFAVCAVVYVVGRLTPMIVEVSAETSRQFAASGRSTVYDIVQFMGQLIATLLPVLEWFNVEAGISAGHAVSLTYLLTAGLYCLIYCTFVLIGALFLFEDRDLA
jgi:ABC-type transport system involved in multi-copper enzyme maturation permease subunit